MRYSECKHAENTKDGIAGSNQCDGDQLSVKPQETNLQMVEEKLSGS